MDEPEHIAEVFEAHRRHLQSVAYLVFAPRGRLSRALTFTIVNGKIVQAEVIADQNGLQQLELAVLGDS